MQTSSFPSSDTLFLHTGNFVDKELQFLNKYSTEVLYMVCQLFQKVLTFHDAEWYLKLGRESPSAPFSVLVLIIPQQDAT
jgi:hypothetical protein